MSAETRDRAVSELCHFRARVEGAGDDFVQAITAHVLDELRAASADDAKPADCMRGRIGSRCCECVPELDDEIARLRSQLAAAEKERDEARAKLDTIEECALGSQHIAERIRALAGGGKEQGKP
jgi:hypothetical protein